MVRNRPAKVSNKGEGAGQIGPLYPHMRTFCGSLWMSAKCRVRLSAANPMPGCDPD
jgi:hypothetical protein